MTSEMMRKRAAWMQAVARKMRSNRSSRHLERTARLMLQMADHDELRPVRL